MGRGAPSMGLERAERLAGLALPVLMGTVRSASSAHGYVQTLPDGSVLITPLPAAANDLHQPPEPPSSAA